jgi:dienelactone hydrolase
MRRLLLTALAALAFHPSLQAQVVSKTIEYEYQGTKLAGTMVWNDSIRERRPGILVAHDWMGHGPFALDKAKQLAREGYVTFAVDMYGKGVYAEDTQQASQLAGAIKKDRALMRGRIGAAFDVLKQQPQVDTQRTGAIGFCFGGTTALELARSGANVTAVVSFHGGLETSMKAEPGKVRAKILVLHGADDPYVPPEEVDAFEKEMKAAKANWELVMYGGTVHSFTQRSAGTDNSKGAAYNEQADRRSFLAMKNFFDEVFGK